MIKLSDLEGGKGDTYLDKMFKADQVIHDEVSKAINKAQLTGDEMTLRVDKTDGNKINIIESRLRGAEVVPKITETKKELVYTFTIMWQKNLDDDDIEFFME